MDRGWKRFAALAVAVGAIVVAFAVLQPSDDELGGEQRSQSAAPESSDGESSGGSQPLLGGARNEAGGKAQPRAVALTFADGEVVGGAKTIEATSGEEILLRVTSDVREELHVHGVDVSRDLPAGEEVEVTFTPEAEGVFEIELHDSGTVIAKLRVRPA